MDVSLFSETTGFVDKLFECLTTKNYLGNPEPVKEIPKVEPKLSAQKQEDREEVILACAVLSVVLNQCLCCISPTNEIFARQC